MLYNKLRIAIESNQLRIASAIRIAIGTAQNKILAEILGQSGFGLVSYYLSIDSLIQGASGLGCTLICISNASLLSQNGRTNTANGYLARYLRYSVFNRINYACLVLCVFMYLLLTTYNNIYDKNVFLLQGLDPTFLLILPCLLVLYSLSRAYQVVLYAYKRVGLISAAIIFGQISLLGVLFIAARNSQIEHIFAYLSFAAVINLLFLFILNPYRQITAYAMKRIRESPQLLTGRALWLTPSAVSQSRFFLISLFASFLIDILFRTVYILNYGVESNGAFQSILLLINTPMTLYYSKLDASLLPALSACKPASNHYYKVLTSSYVRALFVLALIASLVIFFGKQLLTALFSDAFVFAIPLFLASAAHVASKCMQIYARYNSIVLKCTLSSISADLLLPLMGLLLAFTFSKFVQNTTPLQYVTLYSMPLLVGSLILVKQPSKHFKNV